MSLFRGTKVGKFHQYGSILNHVRYVQTKASCIKVDNPYSGEIHCEVPLLSLNEANNLINKCSNAQNDWWRGLCGTYGLIERQDKTLQFIKHFIKEKENIAKEITSTMGKPLTQSLKEVDTMIERAEAILECSLILSDEPLERKVGYSRFIKREPIGIALLICPWNYPLLCTINSLIPAILSGNGVLLKLSSKTPTIANIFSDIFHKADIPQDLIVPFHCDHDTISETIKDKRIGNVTFTGSVQGGYQIQNSCRDRLINTTLELGGKDAAYVHYDCDLNMSAESLVDGALYNAGQSCCAIERVYVHERIYDDFIEISKNIIESYVLNDPFNKDTTMGPMAQENSLNFLSNQVSDATNKGAKIIAGSGQSMKDSNNKGRFFSPTMVIDCNHDMSIMKDESFGPLFCIQKVSNETEALTLINDSEYGLTSSIYTKDVQLCEQLSSKIESGTVYMNACDYLDPLLPWNGIKNTGNGFSLSRYCYNNFTRMKSCNFKLPPGHRTYI